MVGVEDAEEVSWDHGLAEDLSAFCLLGRDQDGSSEEDHAGGSLEIHSCTVCMVTLTIVQATNTLHLGSTMLCLSDFLSTHLITIHSLTTGSIHSHIIDGDYNGDSLLLLLLLSSRFVLSNAYDVPVDDDTILLHDLHGNFQINDRNLEKNFRKCLSGRNSRNCKITILKTSECGSLKSQRTLPLFLMVFLGKHNQFSYPEKIC